MDSNSIEIAHRTGVRSTTTSATLVIGPSCDMTRICHCGTCELDMTGPLDTHVAAGDESRRWKNRSHAPRRAPV